MTTPDITQAIQTAQTEKKVEALEAAPQVSPASLGGGAIAGAVDPKATGYAINGPVRWEGTNAIISLESAGTEASSSAPSSQIAPESKPMSAQPDMIAALRPSETSPQRQASYLSGFSLAGRAWNRLRQAAAQRGRGRAIGAPMSMRPGIGRRSPGLYRRSMAPASAARVAEARRTMLAQQQQTAKPQVIMTLMPPAGGAV